MTTKQSTQDPVQMKLGPKQAQRLAAISGLDAKQLVNHSIAEIAERHKYLVDPQLFFFRRVCGKVVKTDPATGIQYPVPFATVEVQDTDCSLLGYFPSHSPWAWYFPFACHREVIATAKTDACGNFCVWVPRWDIDWVLRWRLERHCYPIIFKRPDLADLLRELRLIRWPPPPPGDPFRLTGVDRLRVANALGADAARKLDALSSETQPGADLFRRTTALATQVLDQRLAPPLPAELQHAVTRSAHADKEGAMAMDAARNNLGAKVHLDTKALSGIDLRRYIGPFVRCVTTLVPEWQPIFDVPDITFRVLQDVDGDGTEEQIYGESYFQVRWDATNIGPVTLEASPIAKAGLRCMPGGIPCADQPAIVLAGWMPVKPAGDPATDPFDPATGYGRLTNRPHVSDAFSAASVTPGAAPLYGTVALLGCNKTDPSANQYRVVYEYSDDDGASWSTPVPFLGLTWPLYRLDGAGNLEIHYPHADSDGWYSIALPAGPNPWLPEDVLIDWPTGSFAGGKYRLTLQLGNGGAVTSSSAPVTFAIDNSSPLAVLDAAWDFSASGSFGNSIVPGTCPVVRRGTAPQDVYFRVTLQASAKHLRSVDLAANDCGVGHFEFVSGTGGVQSGPGSVEYQHWHTSVGDNSQTLTVIYKLPATSAEGTYGFSGEVSGRAFNPSGGDGGQLQTPPWQYNPDDVRIYPNIEFSVINA